MKSNSVNVAIGRTGKVMIEWQMTPALYSLLAEIARSCEMDEGKYLMDSTIRSLDAELEYDVALSDRLGFELEADGTYLKRLYQLAGLDEPVGLES